MKDKSEDRVIVLGAGYGALSIVKALAREGIKPILFFTGSDDHARFSRFVVERVRTPNPINDSGKLLDILMDERRCWDGLLLIPTLDEYVIFISQNLTELKKRYVFTVQEWEITSRIINKNLLYPHARELGIPTPKFFMPDSMESLEKRKNEIVYPCILKPSDSHLFDRIYGKKIILAHNYQELAAGFMDTQKHDLDVIISEIIPGKDSAIYTYRSYMDSQGEILAELCTQKLRQYPTTGYGQGAVIKTIPMIREVRDQALELLRSFNYHGESHTEFKLDERDCQYKLMEINVRHPTGGRLYLKAGVNIPYLNYLDEVKNIRPALTPYREEVYWINSYWEMINFLQLLRSGNLDLRDFLYPYWKETVYAVSFFDDPIHFLIETYLNIKRVFYKIKNRNLF